VVAVSSIGDADRENQINRLVTHNKGIFVKNIERPVKVTHLLCSGDEKTEKMKYAEKFNEKGEANIKLVWEEWFWDCIHFGGTILAYSTQPAILSDLRIKVVGQKTTTWSRTHGLNQSQPRVSKNGCHASRAQLMWMVR